LEAELHAMLLHLGPFRQLALLAIVVLALLAIALVPG
jgi:hypothetical protein